MIATEPKASNELESTNRQKSAMTDGFHLVVDALKLNGIDTIYGVAGIPITDLARLAQAEGMRFIGFRHEQSAGNAAAISGYLTQKPGICLTVSAPGFLNGLVGGGKGKEANTKSGRRGERALSRPEVDARATGRTEERNHVI